MTPARKGTKGNPFRVGEAVWVRGQGTVRGKVAEVRAVERGDLWTGGRGYAPIEYRVVLETTGIEVWLGPRDLEELVEVGE